MKGLSLFSGLTARSLGVNGGQGIKVPWAVAVCSVWTHSTFTKANGGHNTWYSAQVLATRE